MNYCKCGCGVLVEKNYKRGHVRRGMKNSESHNLAISKANKGRKMPEFLKERFLAYHFGRKRTEEERLKLSVAAKKHGFGKWMLGRSPSVETRKKISEINKGHLTSNETREKIGFANSGEKNGMFGKKHSEDIKKIISKSSIEMFKDEKFRLKMKSYWESDEFKRHCRKAALTTAMKLMFTKYTDTKPELEMKKILDELKINYIHPFPVWDIEHCYAADFFVLKGKIIIEVDGLFWHNFPNGLEVDKIRNEEMRSKGYVVLRFWEDKFDIKDVALALNLEVLDERLEI